MKKKINWATPDIGPEEIEAVKSSLKCGNLGGNGPNVRLFEKEFSKKVGAKYAIAVNNGTSALLASLFSFRDYLGKDLKIGVPSFTFIASANVAEVVGSLILTDVDYNTWNIDKESIPSNVNLILPVDVGGLPVDYDKIKKLGIPMIADSAESIGSKYQGGYVGSQADIHCFSLHKAKIITCGEGGMITTNNKELYEITKSWCNHGYDFSKKPWQYRHERVGLNFRMTDMEAAIGRIQLKKLDRYIKKRRRNAKIYKQELHGLVKFQSEPDYAEHAYFFFGVLTDLDNNKLCSKAHKIGIQLKTWDPVHTQNHFKKRNFKDYPNAHSLGKKIVLLPIHNKMSREDTYYVAKKVKYLLQ